MTFVFTLFVVGWLAAFAVIQLTQHQYGYAAFNAAFGCVGAFAAWRDS